MADRKLSLGKFGDLEPSVNDAKDMLGVFVDRIEEMFNSEASRRIGEIGTRASPDIGWQRYGFTREEVELALFCGYEAQRKMGTLFENYYAFVHREPTPAAAVKVAAAETPAEPDAKPKTAFVDACEDVERLGHLLRAFC
jgi:hypothetical protein